MDNFYYIFIFYKKLKLLIARGHYLLKFIRKIAGSCHACILNLESLLPAARDAVNFKRTWNTILTGDFRVINLAGVHMLA